MADNSQNPLIQDWAGSPTPSATSTPVTSRVGQALYTPQGGMVALGSDYAATPKGQVPKVDATGSCYMVPVNPAGGNAQVYTGQPSPAAASQYGTLMMARMDLPSPSAYAAVTTDATGAVQVHQKSKTTFRCIATSVTCGSNLVLFALYNGSSMVLRLNEMNIYVPPAGGSGGLLSANITYYPVFCNLVRTTTAYTGGTSVAPFSADSGDTLSSGVVCAKAPTASGSVAGVFHQADAYVTNLSGIPFYGRTDPNQKTLVIRPGEGAAVICTSSGVINNSGASGTTTAVVNIEATITQAAG